MMPPTADRDTLRRQLLVSLLAPLVLVMLASSVAAYYFAVSFATLAYDRALFDSTLDISGQVKIVDGNIQIDLPAAALKMLESDEHDRVYYMVSGPKAEFVAGHRGLPLPPEDAAPGKPFYYDADYRGNPVRIAALYTAAHGLPEAGSILVQVAETLNKRRTLANEVLLGMLLPELLLIVLVGLLVWYGVARGLRPLDNLRREISHRSHRDLSPLPETQAPGEVRPLIRAMNGLLGRLGTVLSAQRRFVADAAHQLRTPLAGIKTQTELALRQEDIEEVRHTLRQLNTATGRTARLVNQLLSLARAEPGAERVYALHKLDLSALARDTTTEWVPRALARNIDLGFDAVAAAGWIGIEGDALLLKEILSNLLDNAVRYTQPGGQITVRVVTLQDKVELSVEDNGPGIPAAERERVFERFHRVLGTGAEGCGLGLAIVREIAEGHGAQISIDPAGGNAGTIVRITFAGAVPVTLSRQAADAQQ